MCMMITRVTLLGNKDHGKSTMIGSMLMLTRSVTKERIADAQRISRSLKRKFEPGFILDSFSEEREGGLTIDTTRAQIKYKGAAFELIDVPGHEELIHNMISGASYASFAILIISAKEGERITTQTKRHLFLAKMLGIEKIIIAVNKMDTINYSKEAFNSIKDDMLKFLRGIGLEHGNTIFIPVSAYNSDNIMSRSANMPWYKGDILLDAMSKSSGPVKKQGLLRISIQGSIGTGNSSLATGKVISGTIKKSDVVYLFPGKTLLKVAKLYVKGKEKRASHCGDDIAIKFDRRISSARGSIISGKDSEPRTSGTFQSTIFFTKEPARRVALRYNGVEIQALINVKRTIDVATGTELQRKTSMALNAAKVTVKPLKKIAFEKFSEFPELGRFTVYTKSGFSGIGIID